ncbi:NAD-dependent deacylase [Methylomicrobium sp. Wu6]|uniref:SIR2 family NAD-dependent protein deacylase n=1 Tax=Methylomicrobium sp. Wu6 TaxID=3107928 RepID=UPI002DD624CA|nr:NAD-dependent deacylase [Methylomicrobium sp. Wu6]MEC4747528.1 NAD-dependent deacylase [Methylomicrobium sp. Wu6]
MFAEELITAIKIARHIVVLTGAGVSAESGIPTFRDAQTGLWENFDATQLASPQGFQSDPELVWGWYEWRRAQVLGARPNPAHYAIVQFAEQVEQLTLITQNVDDLHERAGSPNVIRLHGSLHQPRCFACASPYAFPEAIPQEPAAGRRLPPSRCPHCNDYIRPGVVWFGESLPEAEWRRAELAAKACDVLLSIGTSALVWPAAQLPIDAARHGAVVVQINPDQTPLNAVARYNIQGKAGEILPGLVDAVAL